MLNRSTLSLFHRGFLLAFVFLFSVSASAQDKFPRAYVPEPTFNFGTVAQGSAVSHDFVIQNKGTASLKIVKIHPSCGCTAAASNANEIAPGGMATVTTTFDTSGFQGEKVKTVAVYTDDSEQAILTLTLQGVVQTDVEVEPFPFDFESVRAGTAPSLSGTVITAADVKITAIEARSDEFDLKTEDLNNQSLIGKKLTVTLKDSAPIGEIRGKILVKSSSPKNPIVVVPVLAKIEGDLSFAPDVVSFSLVDGPLAEPLTRTATLTSRGSKPVKVTAVESDNPVVEASFSPVEEGKTYAIGISIREGSVGIIQARIKVTTDHHDLAQSQLTLPVYAVINRTKK